jgi:hypothetical protein
VPTMPRRVLFLWGDFRGLGRVLAMLVGRRKTMSERVQAGLSRAMGRPKPAVRLERVLALRAKGLSLRADAARGARGDGKFTITPYIVQNPVGCDSTGPQSRVPNRQ